VLLFLGDSYVFQLCKQVFPAYSHGDFCFVFSCDVFRFHTTLLASVISFGFSSLPGLCVTFSTQKLVQSSCTLQAYETG
jgi:hypothetical protein